MLPVVIYDPQYTPTLLDQHDHKYVTAEAVYAVMEVKPTVNKGLLDYAGKKAGVRPTIEAHLDSDSARGRHISPKTSL